MGEAQAGALIVGLAVVLACRAMRVRAGLPLVALLALLVSTGLLSASQVPGVAQVADAKVGLEHWRDRQIAINSAAHKQLLAIENANPGTAGRECPPGPS
jgi:hypothetical protein